MKSPYSSAISHAEKGIPRNKWADPVLWDEFTRLMPIASTDIIFERKDESVLFGYRVIEPYKNVWALVGGRLLIRESLKYGVKRIAHEYGLTFHDLFLVGVYVTSFVSRSTVTIAVAAVGAEATGLHPGKEFTRFSWLSQAPKNVGNQYRGMLSKWKEEKSSPSLREFNRIR